MSDAPHPFVRALRETRALYVGMSSEQLIQVMQAFLQDKAHASSSETIAFAEGRLALIAEVLNGRVPETEASLKNRVIVRRVDSTDGWTELFFSCGHSANIITAVGEGALVPCTDCLLQLLPRMRGIS